MAATTSTPDNMSSPTDSKPNTKPQEPVKAENDSPDQPVTTQDSATSDSKTATSNAQPLAPPPRPAPTTSSDTPDYFNTNHNTTNAFSLEPNVFEQSFSNPSGNNAETPGGRTVLPPVANITSPSPLPGITPGWQSLRAGPLSPAMLTGPANETDYFSGSFGRGGFPTPNESSLRTGLTPGGGGSMFPAPSPGTQAIFNLQSGGVTPGTGDFQQAAARAAQQTNKSSTTSTSAPTSQPETATAGMERQGSYQQSQHQQQQHQHQQQHQQQSQQQQRSSNDPYANHDVSNAANDLLSFAKQNGGARNGQQQFSMGPQQPSQTAGHMPVQPVSQENGRRNTKGSINSMPDSMHNGEFSESGQSEQAKTSTRSRGGKKGGANGKQAAGSKRKADEAQKGGKKAKASSIASMGEEDDDTDDENHIKEEGEQGNKKMTDEEKRKNFLERNRVAALKCRQRKKQWLANLQAKVELFSTENDALSATVTQLREEIVNLKTLLLAHKDCPVSQAQGLHGPAMNNFLGGDINHQNPYGIAQLQPNGVHMGMPMQSGQQMMNRFVFPPSRSPSPDEEHAPYAPDY